MPRHVTINGVNYIEDIKVWHTAFGNFFWSVTNLSTGAGRGGFVDNVVSARQAIREFYDAERKSWCPFCEAIIADIAYDPKLDLWRCPNCGRYFD